MAGRKHHHVPQFLQRRFGASTNKTTQVVVYRKGKEPFKTSTENFGAERDFYAHEGDFFVDDLITKYEGDIQFFFSQLEKGNIDALQDTTTLSELVAHLELRSSFLRSQLLEISGVLSGFIESIFESEARLTEATYRHLKANPQILRDIIVENLGADSPVDALKDFVEPQLKSILRNGSSGVVKDFASKLATMRGEFSEMVKSSHLSILAKGADEVERTAFY